ncbi:MAG: DUF3592 domain-containing protein [Oscillospiraceae bacterium]|nr:DUF3592 domain-containing protein [Oscillospiraceae bacterium]
MFSVIIAVFISIGVLLGIIAGIMTISRKKKSETYTYQTNAVVIAMERKSTSMNGHSSRLWFPVFSYQYQNQKFQKQSHVGTSAQIYQAGQSVAIQINPQNPEQFLLVDSIPFRLATKILWALSAFFIVGTVAVALIVASHI